MKLFEAYDNYISLLPENNDWACFLDGDTLFFESNFGHIIQEYINKYPDTGIFTCYSSRSAYNYLVPQECNEKSDSISYHRKLSSKILETYPHQVIEINEDISGHLMLIKKSTWYKIRPKLLKTCHGTNILGVDTQIGIATRQNGLKILLMKSVYLMHYYRLVEGKKNKAHLIDDTINVLIRTSRRPVSFKRCIYSVLQQKHKNIKIFVSADDEESCKYVINLGLNPIVVARKEMSLIETNPCNIYLNELLDQVNGGWIFILDDDDYLADNDVFKNIIPHLKDDNAIYFIRMIWPNGRIIPSNQNFLNKKIVRKDIGMPCFIFHAKHKHKLSFKPIKQGDYYFINDLSLLVKKQYWLNIIATKIGNTGAYGKPEKI